MAVFDVSSCDNTGSYSVTGNGRSYEVSIMFKQGQSMHVYITVLTHWLIIIVAALLVNGSTSDVSVLCTANFP